MCEQLNSTDITLKPYDDLLVKQMMESIKVLLRQKVQIRFKAGIAMTMELTSE